MADVARDDHRGNGFVKNPKGIMIVVHAIKSQVETLETDIILTLS